MTNLNSMISFHLRGGILSLPNVKSKLYMRSFHFQGRGWVKPSKSVSLRKCCNQSMSDHHNMTRYFVSQDWRGHNKGLISNHPKYIREWCRQVKRFRLYCLCTFTTKTIGGFASSRNTKRKSKSGDQVFPPLAHYKYRT